MGYGHGHNLLARSAFVTGTRVIYKTWDGRRILGTVMGPDQDYFPSPAEMFVSFPSTGFTQQVPVSDLELAEGSGA